MLFITPDFLIQTIIHQTHYEKSDWSRAFNQFTIACELDMINAMCLYHHDVARRGSFLASIH